LHSLTSRLHRGPAATGCRPLATEDPLDPPEEEPPPPELEPLPG
jgi:hypothetical protein